MTTIAEAAVSLLPFELDRPVGGSGVRLVDVVLVELTDADGATGLGFSYVIGGGGAPAAALARGLADRHLAGRPVPPPQAAWRAMERGFNRTGRGQNYVALAAVDVALWDLEARRRGLPLGAAMGGEARPVPVYASGGFAPGMAPSAAAELAAGQVERGLAGVKPRVGAQPADAALLAAVVDAVGAGAFVMADVNEKGDLPRALWLKRLAGELGLLFVEEPLPARDLGGFRRLAAGPGAAVAAGEHLQGLVEFLPYASEGLAAVLQPDLAMAGGLTPCLAVADMAAAAGLTVAPHFLPGLFCHLAAAAPALTLLEEFPLLEPVFDGWPEIAADGTLAPGDAPGHGLSLAAGMRGKAAAV